MSRIQISYKEDYKGWVSFLTYHPDHYARLGNTFFTIKDGQVWEHNNINSEIRNNFYGIFHPYKISFASNIYNNEDVSFKTVMIEGNDSWNLEIKTNYTEGRIDKDEFNKRESYYYAHFRQNEVAEDLNGLKTSGIGLLSSFDSINDIMYFDFIPEEICLGDKIYRNNGASNEFVGEVLNVGSDHIELNGLNGAVVTEDFYFSVKDSRVEGGDLRGYYADITISNNNQYSVELYAINVNVVKSYV